jgi:hypothetical protein
MPVSVAEGRQGRQAETVGKGHGGEGVMALIAKSGGKADFFNCSCCTKTFPVKGANIDPIISICSSCIVSGEAQNILGRVLADKLYSLHGKGVHIDHVDMLLQQIQSSIYRWLYNRARSSFKRT